MLETFGESVDLFRSRAMDHRLAWVLQVGTRQCVPGVSTVKREGWFRDDATQILIDIEAGDDVTHVADVRSMPLGWESVFDFILCPSVLEHIDDLVAVVREFDRVLAPGGLVLVQTHQTFPEHGYPSDFWRFSTDALRWLFSERHGFRTLAAEYCHPCIITPPASITEWNTAAPAWLNVNCVAEKL